MNNDALDRMAEKGGRAHFSLRHGSVIHVNGEKPIRLNDPMTDEEWEQHMRTLGAKPQLVVVDSKGVATGYGYV